MINSQLAYLCIDCEQDANFLTVWRATKGQLFELGHITSLRTLKLEIEVSAASIDENVLILWPLFARPYTQFDPRLLSTPSAHLEIIELHHLDDKVKRLATIVAICSPAFARIDESLTRILPCNSPYSDKERSRLPRLQNRNRPSLTRNFPQCVERVDWALLRRTVFASRAHDIRQLD